MLDRDPFLASRLRSIKNLMILKPGAGLNPGGTRYAYSDTAQQNMNPNTSPSAEKQRELIVLRNIGYVVITGTDSDKPNFHPEENAGFIVLTPDEVDNSFVKI